MVNNLSEKEINDLISVKLKEKYFVLQGLRIPPAELDIVFLDNNTLCLTNIEIKRDNWKKLFFQSLRGKIYCHYSIAILPSHMQKNVQVELFRDEGLGLFFYEVTNGKIDLMAVLEPRYSEKMNRVYKKLLYREFYAQYGKVIYA